MLWALWKPKKYYKWSINGFFWVQNRTNSRYLFTLSDGYSLEMSRDIERQIKTLTSDHKSKVLSASFTSSYLFYSRRIWVLKQMRCLCCRCTQVKDMVAAHVLEWTEMIKWHSVEEQTVRKQYSARRSGNSCWWSRSSKHSSALLHDRWERHAQVWADLRLN